MPESAKSYRVVVGLDFSETASIALDEALRLAARSAPAELHLVAVIDPHHADQLLPSADRHARLEETADRLRDQLAAEGTRAIQRAAETGTSSVAAVAHVRVGAIAEQLAALATEIRADVVVVGTHGRRGIRRLMMGSVAEKAVRLAPCPVLVVRPTDFTAMDGIPEIEPACPECVATRERTEGAQWWCDAHLRAPQGVHIYSRSHRLDQPANPAPFGSV